MMKNIVCVKINQGFHFSLKLSKLIKTLKKILNAMQNLYIDLLITHVDQNIYIFFFFPDPHFY